VHFDLTPRWMDNLFDANNPFVPWLLLFDLVLLLLHIYIVYWVYRDALWRYNRGAPWGLFAAVFPIGGWLFYLMYRKSPLVELDRIDAELFDETEHQWTDYDTYKANRGQNLFKELFTNEEGRSYSPWVQLSRAREGRKALTPEERRDVRQLRRQRRAELRQRRTERRAAARQQRTERRQAARQRQTVTGAHGTSFRLSDRRQRAIQRQLAVMEQLKTLPREDQALEDLIFEMRYAEALAQARAALEVAREMADTQGVTTYEHYIQRLEALLADQA
jgi:hypothetical protein